MNLSQATTAELVEELKKRDHVWSRSVIPCEHYAIVLRGASKFPIEQNIGPAIVLVARDV